MLRWVNLNFTLQMAHFRYLNNRRIISTTQWREIFEIVLRLWHYYGTSSIVSPNPEYIHTVDYQIT